MKKIWRTLKPNAQTLRVYRCNIDYGYWISYSHKSCFTGL